MLDELVFPFGDVPMNKARVSLFIAGVLVIASAATALLLHTKYRQLRDSVEAERAEHERRVQALESELRLARAEISEYQQKLDAAQKIADELEREREVTERLAFERAAKIEELEAELDTLKAPELPEAPAVAVLVEDKAPLVEEVEGNRPTEATTDTSAAGATRTEAAPARSDLERELEEVRAEKRELEMKHAALVGDKADGVPLGEVRVSTGLKLKGKVLVVNDRYRFVVIDLGARDGVEKGMVLILHRERQFIGKCQVEKVYNRMAAADLVLNWMKDEVRVGDGVRKF
jgi:cell shape-determining protein MreC